MDSILERHVAWLTQLEEKHGSPSRPGYHLLHPNSRWAPILGRAMDPKSTARDERGKGPGAPEPNPDGSYPPMTEAQMTERRAAIEKLLKTIVKAGGETDRVHRLPNGDWTPERAAWHDKWMAEMHAKYADVPNNHEALMLGGPPGAGKTTSYTSRSAGGRKIVSEAGRRMGIALDADGNVISHAEVNADAFKELIARDGQVPNPPGVSPMEASSLTHEESSYLAKRFIRELAVMGKNILFDGTLGSESSAVKQLSVVKGLPVPGDPEGRIWTKKPYRVRIAFVSVRVKTSQERARKRWADGQNDYNNGAATGGRLVPSDIISELSAADPRFRSKNEQNFENLVAHRPDLIDDVLPIFDNEVPFGTPPKEIPRGLRPEP